MFELVTALAHRAKVLRRVVPVKRIVVDVVRERRGPSACARAAVRGEADLPVRPGRAATRPVVVLFAPLVAPLLDVGSVPACSVRFELVAASARDAALLERACGDEQMVASKALLWFVQP